MVYSKGGHSIRNMTNLPMKFDSPKMKSEEGPSAFSSFFFFFVLMGWKKKEIMLNEQDPITTYHYPVNIACEGSLGC